LTVLNHELRSAILTLAARGCGVRAIARAVGVDRKSVRKVLAQGTADVPEIERETQLDAWLAEIRALHDQCKGNLVRVQEELKARHGVDVPYSTVTRFCRDAEIGVAPKQAAGRYEFGPGEEMQHDTSPHEVLVGGRLLSLQCASLILCFSRRRFVQYYRRWNRFQARIFLTAGLRFLGGSSKRCMLDNSTVIMVRGTGRDAVPAPEMKAFSNHFGFEFVAHEKGDANRSARVEGPFYHVENNFLPGRTFADLADLNAQAVTWCRDRSAKFSRSIGAIPDELGLLERPALVPLPEWIPDPVEVHPRRVDLEGYVNLHTNRYSVPEDRIGRLLEVHETADYVRIFEGLRLVAEHGRREDGAGTRSTLADHRGRWRRRQPSPPSTEEVALRAASPAFAALCDALRIQRGGHAIVAIRRLHRMWLEYPGDALERAVRRALEFGLTNLERIERMTLQNVRGDFFRLPDPDPEDDTDG
jgi:transposase